MHKLRPAGQIRPMTSCQVARKLQQESWKYEKYGTSLPNCGINRHIDCNNMHIFFKNLGLNHVVVFSAF